MDKDKILAQAQIISDKLNDQAKSKGFHIMAIKELGIDKCYQLASLSLQKQHSGQIKVTAARYYNGCVMQELAKRKEN